HRLYAGDLRTALDVCVGVRLGDGAISVDQGKLGLAGHSTGGGAAILAASEDARVRAVATVAPAEVRPSALDAAAKCGMPGMHIAGGRDLIAPAAGHAEAIAHAWAGPVTLRSVTKATHLGFTEGRHWSQLLLDGKPERSTQRIANALLTAFFLVHLAGEKRYQPLLDDSIKRCPIEFRRSPEISAARVAKR
ncbi:MAG TPA: alpha/beta hydrolase, partial [Pseudonocardiaceae bacterium]